MEPMKPMRPMEPMEPMKPLDGGEPWWPTDLGQPSSSGAQQGTRYAFFGEKQRLLIERDGTLETYDTGQHRISGVGQQDGSRRTLTFSSQTGEVALQDLRRVD
ncbi:hypothetical protein [Lichenihabitans psoromatis]|uniref:hypothetical protein n=1 Tax=Lichenihabitans psoromatis TaxID=2528642 RepID=UPI001038332E|nr:hypothetical protein [Lichenihabitans psoromatis]